MYSVIPKNFLLRNFDLLIGPLIILFVNLLSKILNATLKQFFK